MYTTSNTLHSQFLRTPLFHIPPPSQPHLPRLSSISILSPIRSSSSGNGQGGKEGGSPLRPPPSPVAPPDMVEIRFRRGSRKRQRQQEQSSGIEMSDTTPKTPPKSWEEMTYTEKALELYVGEKGLLFWLNKFAYASIFIIIGGWILFRFVGPSLNLYQLDTPPLPPTAIFKS